MITTIVGHGRSPEGRKWGERIDACGTVVRMWDWHWQAPEDHGTRYDWGLFELSATTTAAFLRYNQRQPARGWIASDIWRSSDRRPPLPAGTDVVDQRRWTETGRQLGGIGASGRLELTRGTIAALWIMERCRAGDTVVLVGFDNVRERKTLSIADGFPQAYRTSPGSFGFGGYIEGAVRYGNHDFGIEDPLLRHFADLRKVRIEFAQDVWP